MMTLPTPLEEIRHPLLDEKHLSLYIKRDDLIHPEIMGNKWRKMKYNLQEMQRAGKTKLITMGGAYSNHIAATAAACDECGYESVGIIRGQELNEHSNPTLSNAHAKGMRLVFVDRFTFRKWRENPKELQSAYPDHYFLPEGGTNSLAIKGCMEIIDEIPIEFDWIVTPIGTGGTMAGLVAATKKNQRVLGISTLKGEFIREEVWKLLDQNNISKRNYMVDASYHFGGYGQVKPELIDFINGFKENFGLQLDPIYTGKSFFAVWDMIKNNKFEKNLKIVLLHTGGIQGIAGFNRKNKNIIE